MPKSPTNNFHPCMSENFPRGVGPKAAAQRFLAESRQRAAGPPDKRPSRGPLPGKRPSHVATVAERLANGGGRRPTRSSRS
jgi:hypothetical protein